MNEATHRPLRVLHIITRMILGGAQENTLLSCALIDRDRFPSSILTGPQAGPEGDLYAEARDRGVPLLFEPALVREVDPWRDATALRNLIRMLRRGRYDIVHTHTAKAGVLGRIAARAAAVPVVIHTAHGWPFHAYQPRPAFWVWCMAERLGAHWSHAIVDVGHAVRDHALANGVGSRDRHVVIRSGIEIEAYRDVAVGRREARAVAGVPDDAFVVGFVGRLDPAKGPFEMLDAFEALAAERADAHLVLVGDGAQRTEVEARVRAAGLDGRVHLLGLRRDVPVLLRAFDVLALPSRWEGQPRVLPQAMAAGLPVVAFRVSGAAEAVRDGETGWVVEPGDTAAFGARLLQLARNPALTRAMGSRAVDGVEEFSASRMVRQLEALYSSLARERGVIA